MHTIKVYRQRNAKLGKGIASTYRAKNTCPPDCPAFEICYAKYGPANLFFDEKAKEGEGADLISFMESLPLNSHIRHHITGDFCLNGKLDYDYLFHFILAHYIRSDVKAWGYTHAWKYFKHNPFQGIQNLIINASCDNLRDVREAKAMGWKTVLIVKQNATDTSDYSICSHAKSQGKIQCKNCFLCAQNHKDTIAFPVHGAKKNSFVEAI